MVRVRQAGVEETLSWEAFEQRVRAGRIAADAELRIEAITAGRWVRAGTLEVYQALRHDEEREYQRQVGAAGPPILTALLVGVQVHIWWFAHLPSAPVGRLMKESAPILEDGQSWRLLTMAFTQVDFGHLFGNITFLALAGYAIERALGWRNLLAIYLASALGGSVASLWLSPWTSSLGSSGAVLGCLAACTVFGVRFTELMPRRLRSLYGLAVLPFLAITTVSGLFNDVTDNYCHVGGLVTGGVLAALLDPEGLERREGHNRALRFGLLAGGALVLIVPVALGSWVEPLYDAGYARWASVEPSQRRDPEPPLATDDGLRFSVPAGWEPSRGLLGEGGFASPVSRHRLFVAVESTTERPLTPEQAVETRRAALIALFPTALVEAPRPVTLGGRPGLSWRATVPSRRLVFVGRATTRGRSQLEVLWEGTEPDRVDRLRTRLFDAVAWNLPAVVVQARSNVAKSPGSRVPRAALADALVDVGEVSEGIDLWRSLVAEVPEDAEAWAGLLRAIALYPDRVTDADALVAEALSRNPASTVIVAAANAERLLGRPDTAWGLLDLGWARAPGDRVIGLARPPERNDLDPGSWLPVTVLRDPITGAARDPAEIERLVRTPITLDAAAAWGARYRAETDTLAANAADAIGGDDPLPALFHLWRHRPADDGDLERHRDGLLQDVRLAAAGETVPWLEGAPVAAIRARRERQPTWP